MDAGGRSLFIIILCDKFSIKNKHLEVHVHENVGKRRDEVVVISQHGQVHERHHSVGESCLGLAAYMITK